MAADVLLRVAVVSASLAWRDRVAALLHGAGSLELIGAAATVQDLARLTPAPDAVIVDVPDADTLEMLMQSDTLPTALVILSDEPDRDVAALGLLAGGIAILERDPSAEHLLAALRAAASGLAALSPAHVATLLGSTPSAGAARSSEWIQPLTPRELQVLRMLSESVPNKSIAAELEISEHTAKFHVSQILAKLGAESRTEAVAIGIRHGLIMV
jgi:DNA-binding NarL/FixJ family response regulator